jgi:hypothetical protein
VDRHGARTGRCRRAMATHLRIWPDRRTGTSRADGSDGATVRRPLAGVDGDVSGRDTSATAAQIGPERDGQSA